jgi:hypothetical protein
MKQGPIHRTRKALFQRGLRQGYLTLAEIEGALPPGSLSPSERWLLYYSLRAAGIDLTTRPPGLGLRPEDDHARGAGP